MTSIPMMFTLAPEVDRLARGDSSALAEAYDAYAEPVYAFARRLVGDDAAAEDLVHDVFVALPSVVKNYRGESTFKTFLLSIAVNHARHHVRSAARRRAALERWATEPTRAPEQPDEELSRRELARELSRALDQLSIEQRVAFVLCEVEQRTSVEAALIANVPEGTVRTRLFHAKKKLRGILAGPRGSPALEESEGHDG